MAGGAHLGRRRRGDGGGQGDTPPGRRGARALATFADCDEPVRTILLGGSNLWFADSVSVLSIPEHAEPLAQHVARLWDLLQHVTGAEALAFARRTNPRLRVLCRHAQEDVLAAIDAERVHVDDDVSDVLHDEWEAFTAPEQAPRSDEFRLRAVAAPAAGGRIAQVVLAERLREVRALVGFTRIDAPGDRGPDDAETPRAPLTRRDGIVRSDRVTRPGQIAGSVAHRRGRMASDQRGALRRLTGIFKSRR